MNHYRRLLPVYVAWIAALTISSPGGATSRSEKDRTAQRDSGERQARVEEGAPLEIETLEDVQADAPVPVLTADPSIAMDASDGRTIAVERPVLPVRGADTRGLVGNEAAGRSVSDERTAQDWWPAALGEKPMYPDAALDYLRANEHYYVRSLQPGEEHAGDPILRAYHRGRILPDWYRLRPHLPERVTSVLDIGSGLGAIDLLIYRHLGEPHLTFVDRAQRWEGTRKFNVIETSRGLLSANGVPLRKMTHLDAYDSGTLGKIAAGSYDLVLSLRGLGYLFPYEAYRDAILASIMPGGSFILDARNMVFSRAHAPEHAAEMVAAGLKESEDLIADLERDFNSVRIVPDKGTDRIRLLARDKR